MNAGKLACAAAAAWLAAMTAVADESTVVDNVLGPEGPLYLDGNLYYVGWISNSLSKWDGRTVTVLNSAAGCGHNGLALTKRKIRATTATRHLHVFPRITRSWSATAKDHPTTSLGTDVDDSRCA